MAFVFTLRKTMGSFKPLSVIVFCFLLGGAVVTADSPFVTDESDSLYGKGVHAFFDRDYQEAVTILSKAEEIKTNDPRPYYFLGLAHLRQKNTEVADQYFKKAAQLEFNGHSLRDYAVSESLRRIQGTERIRIEEIRNEERTNALAKERRLREMRYSREKAVDRENLRQTTPSNRHENRQPADLAALQKAAGDLGENAFGIKPIDPIHTTAENIVTRKAETNPFGEVTIHTTAEPEIPVVTTVPSNQATAAPLPKRTFVNPDIAGEIQEPVQSQTAASTNPVRSVQTAAAKELGRALGTLFSGKASPE
jgi:tetratricopeptide (TPR) repeat protein